MENTAAPDATPWDHIVPNDFDSSEYPIPNENVNDLNRYRTGENIALETADGKQKSCWIRILDDLEPPAGIEPATC